MEDGEDASGVVAMEEKSADSMTVFGIDEDGTVSKKRRRKSLGRRVSFAEATSCYIFPRDDDYETPPGRGGERRSPRLAAKTRSAADEVDGEGEDKENRAAPASRRANSRKGRKPLADRRASPASPAMRPHNWLDPRDSSAQPGDDDNTGPVDLRHLSFDEKESDVDDENLTLDSTTFALKFLQNHPGNPLPVFDQENVAPVPSDKDESVAEEETAGEEQLPVVDMSLTRAFPLQRLPRALRTGPADIGNDMSITEQVYARRQRHTKAADDIGSPAGVQIPTEETDLRHHAEGDSTWEEHDSENAQSWEKQSIPNAEEGPGIVQETFTAGEDGEESDSRVGQDGGGQAMPPVEGGPLNIWGNFPSGEDGEEPDSQVRQNGTGQPMLEVEEGLLQMWGNCVSREVGAERELQVAQNEGGEQMLKVEDESLQIWEDSTSGEDGKGLASQGQNLGDQPVPEAEEGAPNICGNSTLGEVRKGDDSQIGQNGIGQPMPEAEEGPLKLRGNFVAEDDGKVSDSRVGQDGKGQPLPEVEKKPVKIWRTFTSREDVEEPDLHSEKNGKDNSTQDVKEERSQTWENVVDGQLEESAAVRCGPSEVDRAEETTSTFAGIKNKGGSELPTDARDAGGGVGTITLKELLTAQNQSKDEFSIYDDNLREEDVNLTRSQRAWPTRSDDLKFASKDLLSTENLREMETPFRADDPREDDVRLKLSRKAWPTPTLSLDDGMSLPDGFSSGQKSGKEAHRNAEASIIGSSPLVHVETKNPGVTVSPGDDSDMMLTDDSFLGKPTATEAKPSSPDPNVRNSDADMSMGVRTATETRTIQLHPTETQEQGSKQTSIYTMGTMDRNQFLSDDTEEEVEQDTSAIRTRRSLERMKEALCDIDQTMDEDETLSPSGSKRGDGESVHFRELSTDSFLQLVEVQFSSELHRVREVLHDPSLAETYHIRSLSDSFHYACIVKPELQVLRQGCEDLDAEVQNKMCDIKDMEQQLTNNNPPIFRYIQTAPEWRKREIRQQLNLMRHSLRVAAEDKFLRFQHRLETDLCHRFLEMKSMLQFQAQCVQEACHDFDENCRRPLVILREKLASLRANKECSSQRALQASVDLEMDLDIKAAHERLEHLERNLESLNTSAESKQRRLRRKEQDAQEKLRALQLKEKSTKETISSLRNQVTDNVCAGQTNLSKAEVDRQPMYHAKKRKNEIMLLHALQDGFKVKSAGTENCYPVVELSYRCLLKRRYVVRKAGNVVNVVSSSWTFDSEKIQEAFLSFNALDGFRLALTPNSSGSAASTSAQTHGRALQKREDRSVTAASKDVFNLDKTDLRASMQDTRILVRNLMDLMHEINSCQRVMNAACGGGVLAVSRFDRGSDGPSPQLELRVIDCHLTAKFFVRLDMRCLSRSGYTAVGDLPPNVEITYCAPPARSRFRKESLESALTGVAPGYRRLTRMYAAVGTLLASLRNDQLK